MNWSDPKEVQEDSDVFLKLVYALFGLYVWELFVTCDFEWSLLTRQRIFRWPLSSCFVFFFMCRYFILCAFVGLIVSFSVTARINCKALYTFNSFSGNMTILCASTSLMLRTIALWERKRAVIVILGTLGLAHWALLWRGMFIVTASWDDAGGSCVVTGTNPAFLNIVFFYTMGFDFVILCFTAVALTKRHSTRTDLWKLLFHDGLVYFLVSFATNTIAAIFNVLDLNMIMNVIATVPSAAITAIAACRAVIRLQEYTPPDLYIHSASNIVHANRQSLGFGLSKPTRHNLARPEVHVTTEHITMSEFPCASDSNSPQAENYNGRKSSADLESKEIEARYEKESLEYTTVI